MVSKQDDRNALPQSRAGTTSTRECRHQPVVSFLIVQHDSVQPEEALMACLHHCNRISEADQSSDRASFECDQVQKHESLYQQMKVSLGQTGLSLLS